jgi:hypothetical protein
LKRETEEDDDIHKGGKLKRRKERSGKSERRSKLWRWVGKNKEWEESAELDLLPPSTLVSALQIET